MFKDEPSNKFVNEYEGIESAQHAQPQTFEHALEKATARCAEMCQAMANYAKQVVDKLFPILKSCADLVAEALKTFPNRRIVHLALYSKNPRTRKKNRKRIIKWMEGNK